MHQKIIITLSLLLILLLFINSLGTSGYMSSISTFLTRDKINDPNFIKPEGVFTEADRKQFLLLSDEQIKAIVSVFYHIVNINNNLGSALPLFMHNLINTGLLKNFADDLLRAKTEQDAINIFDSYNTKFNLLAPPPPTKPVMYPQLPPPPTKPVMYPQLPPPPTKPVMSPQLPPPPTKPVMYPQLPPPPTKPVMSPQLPPPMLVYKPPTEPVMSPQLPPPMLVYKPPQPPPPTFQNPVPMASSTKSSFMTTTMITCASFDDNSGNTNVAACKAQPNCIPVVPPFSSAQRCIDKTNNMLNNPAFKNSFKYL